MQTHDYVQRRGELRTYFDATAAEAWSRLTSDAPVSRIRATVRAGRDSMRGVLLSWLPQDLRGARVLDAGCGTGALAVEAASRGATVVAIDLAATLVDLARQRSRELMAQRDSYGGSIEFRVGDMLDADLGSFDFTVAMDSLIHYPAPEMVAMLSRLAATTRSAVLFTFAPRTPALAVMHAVGRMFPRQDRAPAIEPVDAGALEQRLAIQPSLGGWRKGRSRRIDSYFYTSQAMELERT
jgi:magnesium-protoporphyrin O-methyltransferase